MQPAVDLVDGLNAVSSLAYGLRHEEVATELVASFPTDATKWIDGRDL